MLRVLNEAELAQVSGGWRYSLPGISMGGNDDGSWSWVNAHGHTITTTKTSTYENTAPPP